MTDDPPRVAIPCCTKTVGLHPFHIVGDKYIRAVADGAGAVPLLLPALGARGDLRDLLSGFDGLLITGSMSNVAPEHYGGPSMHPDAPLDPERDATVLPLIRLALAQGVPVLAICRGIQELNVALGGTLHQKVHEVPGRFDHRSDKTQPVDVQYGPAHAVRLVPDGVLAGLFGREEIVVNSIHWQGIDRLSEDLSPEAMAEDGQIEAVRVRDARAFALGVQWHPEWQFEENRESALLFQAFGEEVRGHAARRRLRAAE